jgi:hypothetical protein
LSDTAVPYFSIDGGVTNLANFNNDMNVGDLGMKLSYKTKIIIIGILINNIIFILFYFYY